MSNFFYFLLLGKLLFFSRDNFSISKELGYNFFFIFFWNEINVFFGEFFFRLY